MTTPVFLTEARLAALRQRITDRVEPTWSAFQALQAEVTAWGELEPQVPEDWYVPGYYRDAEGHQTKKGVLMNDANHAYALALYARLTGDEDAARKAAHLADGWASLFRRYSLKDDSTLCFSYHFPAMLFAADLLRGTAAWTGDMENRFKAFLMLYALPLNTMDRDNNWGNWGLLLVTAIGAYLDDLQLLADAEARWKSFIESQIAEEGYMPHEIHRNQGSSGIWYTHFSLMPQTLAAEVLRLRGTDLFDYVSSSGRTLRQAVEWIAPWVENCKAFPYLEPNYTRPIGGHEYISYWEILLNRWDMPALEESVARRRPMTADHSTPHLTLTHGHMPVEF